MADTDFSFDVSEAEPFTDSFLHLCLPSTYASSTVVSAASFSASIDPVVLFSVLDHYLRRPDSQPRVIGTLLGIRSSDDIQEVEVRNSFPLAIVDGHLDVDYFRSMLSLHARVNPRENVVGWYATGTLEDIDELCVEVHSYFTRGDKNLRPVFLLVDPEMKNAALGIKALVGAPVGVPGLKEAGSMFLQVPCDFKYSDAERAGLDIIAAARDAPSRSTGLLSDMDNLEQSIVKVREKIDRMLTYVNDVVDGKVANNNAVGRYLMDTVSTIPRLEQQEFETMFNKHLSDLLMVVYLANLTRTQLAIAERLHNMSGLADTGAV
ncbi:Eukaryotic translation initiation factor 3 subunit F, partial [Nowakowskiella sp. JEL0078]